MTLRKIKSSIVLLFFTVGLYAQSSLSALDYTTFMSIVKEHHPIAYQANLRPQAGTAKILKAKGGFDVKLNGSIAQKYFDNKNYYNNQNYGFKIPTWLGITINGNYTNNQGLYVNPENYSGNTDLWSLGGSITLGRGLFIDQRRAELKQAKIYASSTLQEQKLILNQLLLDASIAYWDWFKAYNKVMVYTNALEVIEERFANIQQSTTIGDKPLVDTLKVHIQMQDRLLKLEQARLDLNNKRAGLEIFLWKDGNLPLELDSLASPPNYENINLENALSADEIHIKEWVERHPELLYYTYGIEMTKIETRLKREQLKPHLELKYNALQSNLADEYNIENYKWGATLSYNLFTRKERGSLKLQELKLQEKQWALTNKKATIEYKITTTVNNLNSSFYQVELAQQKYTNYHRLFLAEQTLFNIGESSMFLVNTRDNAQIKAQLEVIDLIYLNHINRSYLNYQIVQW